MRTWPPIPPTFMASDFGSQRTDAVARRNRASAVTPRSIGDRPAVRCAGTLRAIRRLIGHARPLRADVARTLAFGPILDRHEPTSTKLVTIKVNDRSAMSERYPRRPDGIRVLAKPRVSAPADARSRLSTRARRHGSTIYVRHESLQQIRLDDLRTQGASVHRRPDHVPTGAMVVFSASGVSKAVQRRATARVARVRTRRAAVTRCTRSRQLRALDARS